MRAEQGRQKVEHSLLLAVAFCHPEICAALHMQLVLESTSKAYKVMNLYKTVWSHAVCFVSV